MITTNTFEKVKKEVSLKEYANANLEHKGRALICPNCKSGTHKSATPAFSIQSGGERWKCFACNESGDIFDLAGLVTGNTDKRAELEAVAAWANIPLEEYKPTGAIAAPSTPQAPPPKKPAKDYSEGQKKHAAYIKECAANMWGEDTKGRDYLTGRGFTDDEIKQFGFGYDPLRKRVVLPWVGCDYYHIDRDITGNAPNKYSKPKTEEVGPQPLFNPKAADDRALFIVEGVLDAYAIMAEGYLSAIPLCGTYNRDVLEAIITSSYPQRNILLMLDADEPGRKAQQEFIESLKENENGLFSVYEVAHLEGYKDAADYLAHRGELKDACAKALQEAEQARVEEYQKRYIEALARFHVIEPMKAAQSLYLGEELDEPVQTGFETLDKSLNGGLTRGVITLGAVSSLGKTTLALQIADHIAANRRSVLFVTIEQSARELIAKSISRIMRGLFEIPDGVVDASSLMNKRERDTWGEIRYSNLLMAFDKYAAEVAPNLRILEGVKQPSVSDTQKVASLMCEHNGEAPVIFIDYLQLLAAQNERDGEKETTDKNIMSLRQLARDLKTPIFNISSLNRASYSGVINLDSFKESGAIEYGSDILLGLQPRGIEDDLAGTNDRAIKSKGAKIVETNKRQLERKCELKVLKNRNGCLPDQPIPLNYLPVSNLFYEPCF